MFPFSCHTYILPFTVANMEDKALDQIIQNISYTDWKELSSNASDLPFCQSVHHFQAPKIIDGAIAYAYERYFNQEVRRIAYLDKQFVRNYSLKIGKGEKIYRISVEQDELSYYDLQVDYVMVRMMATINAGFLIISCSNWQYSDLQDIKRINQFGRRIFSPYFVQLQSESDVPNNLEFLSKEASQKLPHRKAYSRSYHVMDAITDLLGSFFRMKEERIFPEKVDDMEGGYPYIDTIIDDRMFVHSYICHPSLKRAIRRTANMKWLRDADLKQLYSLAYVDQSEASCQNRTLLQKLLNKSMYPCWSDTGGLYLASQHSFLFLWSGDPIFYLLDYFQAHYLEISLIVLSQRLGILYFSRLAGECERMDREKLVCLQKNYVSFKSQYMLPEISAQEQAVELYHMLQINLYVPEYSEVLDNQLNAIHETTQSIITQEQFLEEENMNYLLLVFTVLSVVDFVGDKFGGDKGGGNSFTFIDYVIYSFITLTFIILTIAFMKDHAFIDKIHKLKKVMRRIRKRISQIFGIIER
ncbi:hypothetical protein JNG37_00200 [Streptococcus suis]|uniref:Uncharacterized protein n=1 Tax=Streptococcus suis TaxID=1307 RepID=A0A4T2GT80_STRSU|nr:hypothetical protein [Streptococcus suis]MBM7268971.1 hypothetical protein [Streptococcus suis]MBM7269315.1 hypothetical protein [Streptococcus suis]TII00094.1 hypothetical protein FAJ39_03185 [Streptococcus suis]TII01011.1 hypothetical protein FAJ39_01410 [Streptococcus suis]